MTKSDKPALLGAVIMYPYKWTPEQSEEPQPKNRTCCVVLELGVGTNRQIALVPISDRPSPAALEMTQDDIRRAGLSSLRRAYVHADQYNLDFVTGSYTFNPGQKPLGRLSRALLRDSATALAKHIRSGQARRIVRT